MDNINSTKRVIEKANELISAGCAVTVEGQLCMKCPDCKKEDCIFSDKNAAADYEKNKNLENQYRINDYVQSVKARMMLGVNGFMPYPYDKEKKLTYAILTGNSADAKRYLNEILGHIFFASANDLNAIKVRAMELTVVISRAAIESGADISSVYQDNPGFITEFFRLETVEDVCLSLSEVLKRFTDEVFKPAQVKHLEIITKAVSFISNNYMHKITLEDVAEHIYLSPSYLSKIFKDEMKIPFSAYLNTVRIEKSKILLMSEKLSVNDVSALAGFYDQSYFNKVFKKIVGITPKKFREKKGL